MPVTLRLLPILAALLVFIGCGNSGPPSTETTSSTFSTVKAKADFLHQYVTFRRTYESLDFDITYHNNGGSMMPGPSEWDIRLTATVPASELQLWIPLGVEPSSPDVAWLNSVPTTLDLSGVEEWYRDGNRIVGIDRQRRVVAYRSWAE